MDAGYGGPVWHASIASHGLRIPESVLEQQALAQLAGVGDPDAGEWIERRGSYVHVRRRLSEYDLAALPAEAQELVDVRTWAEHDLVDLVSPVVRSYRLPQQQAAVISQARAELGL